MKATPILAKTIEDEGYDDLTNIIYEVTLASEAYSRLTNLKQVDPILTTPDGEAYLNGAKAVLSGLFINQTEAEA